MGGADGVGDERGAAVARTATAESPTQTITPASPAQLSACGAAAVDGAPGSGRPVPSRSPSSTPASRAPPAASPAALQ